MKETVLLYNFTDKGRLMKVRQALMPLGFRIKTVPKEDFGKPLGMLAGVKGMEDTGELAPYEGPGFEEEMAVMAGFSSSQVDAFIRSLRKRGVGRIDYKAILTPGNVGWDSVTLFHEIKKEHEVMTGKAAAEGPQV